MQALSLEQRAVAAARTVATDRGVACEQAAVVYSGSNVLVHLRPAAVVARVMTGTVVLHDHPRRWLEREVSVLRFLAPSGLAVAPSSLIAPGPYAHDGLWLTCWEWVSHQRQTESHRRGEPWLRPARPPSGDVRLRRRSRRSNRSSGGHRALVPAFATQRHPERRDDRFAAPQAAASAIRYSRRRCRPRRCTAMRP